MIPIGIPELPIAGPLMTRCFEESGIKERVTLDQCLGWADGMLKEKKMELFLDSLDTPTAILCLADGQSFFPNEKPLAVMLVYILPEFRSMLLFRNMARVIEGRAAMTGKNAIYASEWVYGSNPEIGALWEALGYKRQEIVYVKLLN